MCIMRGCREALKQRNLLKEYTSIYPLHIYTQYYDTISVHSPSQPVCMRCFVRLRNEASLEDFQFIYYHRLVVCLNERVHFYMSSSRIYSIQYYDTISVHSPSQPVCMRCFVRLRKEVSLEDFQFIYYTIDQLVVPIITLLLFLVISLHSH